MMAKRYGVGILATIFLVGTSMSAVAAEDIGKREYLNNCAVCHGTTGKGDGPMAGIVSTRIPDLTVLQKSSNGVFPFDRVFQTIDGRVEIKAHGTRDMPVWGNEYNAKAAQYFMDYAKNYDAEGFIRGRILALVSFIFGMQEK